MPQSDLNTRYMRVHLSIAAFVESSSIIVYTIQSACTASRPYVGIMRVLRVCMCMMFFARNTSGFYRAPFNGEC